MSININVVSDKPEFTNFFSEQIVLPSNCEATMVKANMDIPLLQMVAVRVPVVIIGNRGEIACYVTIDGILQQMNIIVDFINTYQIINYSLLTLELMSQKQN